MCKEDIREGRRKVTRVTPALSPTAGLREVAPPSKERTHLFFASQNTDNIRIFVGNPNAGTVEGFLINSTLPPVNLDIETHGDVVKGSFWSNNAGVADLTFLLIETFWTDPDGKG